MDHQSEFGSGKNGNKTGRGVQGKGSFLEISYHTLTYHFTKDQNFKNANQKRKKENCTGHYNVSGLYDADMINFLALTCIETETV